MRAPSRERRARPGFRVSTARTQRDINDAQMIRERLGQLLREGEHVLAVGAPEDSVLVLDQHDVLRARFDRSTPTRTSGDR